MSSTPTDGAQESRGAAARMERLLLRPLRRVRAKALHRHNEVWSDNDGDDGLMQLEDVDDDVMAIRRRSSLSSPTSLTSSSSIARITRNAAAHAHEGRQLRQGNAVKAAFDHFDADGDGLVALDELPRLLAFMGCAVTAGDLDHLLHHVRDDSMHSSTAAISRDEFDRFIGLYKESAQLKLLEQPPAIMLAGDATETARGLSRAFSDLHSDSLVVGVWEAITLVIATYVWCVALYGDTLNDTDLLTWVMENVAVYAASVLIFMADALLHWHVCHPHGGQPGVLARVDVWRIIDVIASLPFELVAGSLALGSSASDAPTFTLALRVAMHVKAFKFLSAKQTYFKASGHPNVRVGRVYVTFFHSFIPPIGTGCAVAALCALFAIVWYVIGRSSWSSLTADTRNVVDPFTEAVYVVAYSVTAVGYGTVAPSSDGQKLFGAFLCLVAQVMQAYVVGSIVRFIAETDVTGETQNWVVETDRIARIGALSRAATQDAVAFEDHLVTQKLSECFGTLLDGLPLELSSNITIFVKVRLLANCHLFSTADRTVLVAMARALVAVVARPGEALFVENDVVSELLLVAHGEAFRSRSDGSVAEPLRAGDVLNEEVLLRGPHRSTCAVRCVTHCEVLSLSQSRFAAVRHMFPKFNAATRAVEINNGAPLASVNPLSTAEPTTGGEDASSSTTAILLDEGGVGLLEMSVNVRPAPPITHLPSSSPHVGESWAARRYPVREGGDGIASPHVDELTGISRGATTTDPAHGSIPSCGSSPSAGGGSNLSPVASPSPRADDEAMLLDIEALLSGIEQLLSMLEQAPTASASGTR